jgi:hypothetical protein
MIATRTACWRALSLALLVSASTLCAQEVRSALTLWATDGMAKVRRDAAPGAPTAPPLYAAANEWEPFQLVVSGSLDDLRNTVVTCGLLQSESGAVIPAPVILREHYVELTSSSELAPEPKGWFPDALVPQNFEFDDPPEMTNGRRNQPYWIDFFIPPGTAPGDYVGEVCATTTDGTRLRMPVTLHVWAFELPRIPACRTSMCLTWRRVAEVHGFDPKAPRAEGKLLRILDDYYDMLVAHRLSPHEVWAAYPNADDPITEASYAEIEKGLRQHLLERGAGTISLPLWETWPFAEPLGKDRAAALDYCARYYRIVEKLGGTDRLYKLFGELDEPNSAAAYQHVHEWGSFFDELAAKHGVRVKLLLTEKPLPDDPTWGSLIGTADIWVPHVSNVWQDLESGQPTRSIPERIQAGDEVWTYTALVQTPEEWKKNRGYPEKLIGSQPPVWLTDYPSINYRILPWLMPIHGITGFTYWDTSAFPGDGFDPWKNAGTYPHPNGTTFQGDGFLIYPARADRHPKEGPCASLRLKWLREGVDDYDYLALLSARGFKKSALEIGQTFARGFGDWEPNTEKLYSARKELGELLSKLHERSQ